MDSTVSSCRPPFKKLHTLTGSDDRGGVNLKSEGLGRESGRGEENVLDFLLTPVTTG